MHFVRLYRGPKSSGRLYMIYQFDLAQLKTMIVAFHDVSPVKMLINRKIQSINEVYGCITRQ